MPKMIQKQDSWRMPVFQLRRTAVPQFDNIPGFRRFFAFFLPSTAMKPVLNEDKLSTSDPAILQHTFAMGEQVRALKVHRSA